MAQAQRAQLARDLGEQGFDVLVTSYSYFEGDSAAQVADRRFLCSHSWGVVVFDEAHALKDRRSSRFRRLARLQANPNPTPHPDPDPTPTPNPNPDPTNPNPNPDQLYSIDTSGVSARFFATAMGKVSPRPALQMEATPHPHTPHRPTHPYPHTLVLDRDGQYDPRPYWPNLAHTSRSALSVAP